MPTLYKRNCLICQACRGNPRLRTRIRHAIFERQADDETLKQIAEDVGLNVSGMYNHARKHVRDRTDTNERVHQHRLKKTEIELKAKMLKDLDVVINEEDADTVAPRPQEIISLDDYIAAGAMELKSGNLKISASSWLAAIKIKTDWSSKQQNNQIELLKTLNAFRSGARKQTDATRGPAEDDNRGAEKPTTVHIEATRDGVARGPKAVLEASTEEQ